MEKSGNAEFVLIGAGLPRTGTMSTRAALKQLLNGDIYHMETVGKERKDHHLLWWKALGGEITKYIICITLALVVYILIKCQV